MKPLLSFLLTITLFSWSNGAFGARNLVPQTGQRVSFHSGDDGALKKGIKLPTPRFIDTGDGTILDKLTDLIWLRNGNCMGRAVDWQEALDKALVLENGECGLSDGSSRGDWRLPNIRELDSLVHEGFHDPALSNRAGNGKATENEPFINFDFSGTHWSSTTRVDNPAYAFVVDYGWGSVKTNLKTSKRSALFVRGDGLESTKSPVFATHQKKCYDITGNEKTCTGTGQDGELQKGLSWPVPRFSDNGDGTITDYLSGLIWLKNSNCFDTKSWSSALDAVNSLKEGRCNLSDNSTSGDWHMPNRKELYSLIDFNSSYPALSNSKGDNSWKKNDAFINVRSLSYWSSTTYHGDTSNTRTVHLGNSGVGLARKTATGYFWPVRSGEIRRTLNVAVRGQGQGTVMSTPTGITCPGKCRASFEYLSTVELTAQALPGSRFTHWSVAECGKKKTCQVKIQGTTQTISAFFEKTQENTGWLMLLLLK